MGANILQALLPSPGHGFCRPFPALTPAGSGTYPRHTGFLFLTRVYVHGCSPCPQGQYGAVLLCTWTGSVAPVAVKVQPRTRAAAPGLGNEVAACRAVQGSPFHLQLLHDVSTASLRCLVFAYAPGGDLFAVLQDQHALAPATALFFAAEVAAGLEYMHARHLIYRDVSLSNTLLDAAGHVLLCDMGSCAVVPPGLPLVAFELVGTPEYMAPEMLTDEAGYGPAVDWWALGVLLYELAVGRPPFWGGSGCGGGGDLQSPPQTLDAARMEKFRQICEEDPRFPPHGEGRAADPLPPSLLALMRGLLHKDPRARTGLAGFHAHPSIAELLGPWERVAARELASPLPPLSDSIAVDDAAAITAASPGEQEAIESLLGAMARFADEEQAQ